MNKVKTLLGSLFIVTVLSISLLNAGGQSLGHYNAVVDGNFDGCGGGSCHNNGQTASLNVTLTGAPAYYDFLQTYQLNLTVSGGPAGNFGGFNLEVEGGTLSTTDPNVKVNPGQDQATHSSRNARSWNVSWTAPPSDVGDVDIWVVAMAADGDGVADDADLQKFITVTVEDQPETIPPEISNVLLNGAATQTYSIANIPALTLTATLNDTGALFSDIGGANYTVGVQNWATSQPMSLQSAPTSPNEVFQATILAPTEVGIYRYYAYGWDAEPNYNTTNSLDYATLNITAAPPPESHVNNISYYNRMSPITVTATASDTGGGIKNVTLWHRHQGFEFGAWSNYTFFGTLSSTPWAWNFDFPEGEGYYQFYTIATDNLNLSEAPPPIHDQMCGYDMTNPGIVMNTPANGSHVNPGTVLDFTISDNTMVLLSWYTLNDESIPHYDPLFPDTNEIDTTGWTDGEYKIEVFAQDWYNNNLTRSYIIFIDSMPPEITSAIPTAGETGVDTETDIVITFSESMHNASVESAFSISNITNTTVIRFYWAANNTQLTVDLSHLLPQNKRIDVTVDNTAHDLAFNHLVENHTFWFMTWIDTDGDGIPNDVDTDDDGDNVADSLDALPLDPSETQDSDGDGIGNNADPDDDNDGVYDSEDQNPLDPSIGRASQDNYWPLIILVIMIFVLILIVFYLFPRGKTQEQREREEQEKYLRRKGYDPDDYLEDDPDEYIDD